jgi:hypothetical protein
MIPNDPEQLSAEELLRRSQEIHDQFAILTRVMEAAGFPVGDEALAQAGISRPRLHQLYTPEEGVAAFGEGLADWDCDGQFALLPTWVLGFFTLGDPASRPLVDTPKRVHWRPDRLDYAPGEEQPWLPQAIRQPLGPGGRPHHNYALFLRRAGDDRYLYAGLGGLSGWTNPNLPVADFELRERLPREVWERFGGWSGWWGSVGARRLRLAVGDEAGLQQQLADLGPEDSIYLTRYEGDGLAVYLTAERGHVHYSEANQRDGRVAHDPAIAADSTEEVEFTGNQCPWQVPLRDTLPRAEAVAAAVEFVCTGRPPMCVGDPPPPPPPPPDPPPGPRVGLHTEPEWLAETNPEQLLLSIRRDPLFDVLDRLGGRDRPTRPHLRDRKLWLLAVACCRRVWHLMTDDRTRRMVEVVERWADGRATDEERAAAGMATQQAWEETSRYYWGRDEAADAAHQALHATTTAGAELGRPEEHYQPGMRPSAVAAMVLIETARAVAPDYRNSPERPVQADLLRCLAGNPFRPVAFDAAWRTKTALALAEAIYAERAWDRLPVLADALEEAGCADADVLAHCRDGGPHARGCWVVDGLFGRG